MDENNKVLPETLKDGVKNDGGDNAANKGGSDSIKTEKNSPKTFSEADIAALTSELSAKHAEDTQKAVEEALKKAKMSKDALAAYEQEQKENALNQREQSLVLRELTADTIKLLSEKELPADILDLVIADNKENTEKRIEAFKTVFDKSVQAEVTKRIAGKTPPTGSSNTAASVGASGFLKTILDNQAKRK